MHYRLDSSLTVESILQIHATEKKSILIGNGFNLSLPTYGKNLGGTSWQKVECPI